MPASRRQMIKLVHGGRDPDDLAVSEHMTDQNGCSRLKHAAAFASGQQLSVIRDQVRRIGRGPTYEGSPVTFTRRMAWFTKDIQQNGRVKNASKG